MESGELHGQPELQTGDEKSAQSKSSQARPTERNDSVKKKRQKGEAKSTGAAEDSVGGDDFFEVDDESPGSASA